MKIAAVLTLAVAVTAPCLSSHPITVDGNPVDWIGVAPAQVYSINPQTNGEWIYTGVADDARNDPGGAGDIEKNYDITEVRFTVDDTLGYLYVLVRFKDVTDIDEPYIAIGVELDAVAVDTRMSFLGDESGLGFQSGTDNIEHQVTIHNGTSGTTWCEYHHDGPSDTWFTPPGEVPGPGVVPAYIDPSNDLLEARILMSSAGISAAGTPRIFLASFDNLVGFNNAVDTTVDYNTAGAPDAVDCIGGGVVGTPEGAFTRELSDADIDGSNAIDMSLPTGTVPVELSTFMAD